MKEPTRRILDAYMDTAGGLMPLEVHDPFVDLAIGAAQTEMLKRDETVPLAARYIITPKAMAYGDMCVRVLQANPRENRCAAVDFRIQDDPDYQMPALVPEQEIVLGRVTTHYLHIGFDAFMLDRLTLIAEELSGSRN